MSEATNGSAKDSTNGSTSAAEPATKPVPLGGRLVAESLVAHGVETIFTLCGGHISPILVGAKRLGIRIVDVRHEVNAAFAADATSRLTGIPGVAVVTAGPGVTNAITAVKNAELAQSPFVLIGGATATVLRDRGSLQDIDQLALVRPHVKWAGTVGRVRDLPETIAKAFEVAQRGVPGPVFVEIPVDLLYDQELVESWYGAKGGAGSGKDLSAKLMGWYLEGHVAGVFSGGASAEVVEPRTPRTERVAANTVARALEVLEGAQRPVLVVGSQALANPMLADEVADAIRSLGIPVWLSGMARGILGGRDPLQRRHSRKEALREADVVVLAGLPCDFRLDYGRQIPGGTTLISVNRSRTDLSRNRRPNVPALGDPALFLLDLAAGFDDQADAWAPWKDRLAERDRQREERIDRDAEAPAEGGLNPLLVCRALDAALAEDSFLVADGGDFVATASYTVRPRGPLRWLDPGPFGTLGVGAGFAAAAKVANPASEVWLLYGDGSVGFSIAELDTFARHGLGIIAIVGNDAAWMQIARDQVDLLGDDVGCTLARTNYHLAAEGFGARGLLVTAAGELEGALQEAKAIAATGSPVLVNIHLGRTDFRKGSLSM